MAERVKLRFAPTVPVEHQSVLRRVLSQKPDESQRILHNHRSQLKAYYRVETPIRPLFIKFRPFNAWHRRLGRMLQRTKEERELRNYLMLAERGLPCPEPIGSGRLFGGPLIKGSMLILEYLSDALPLRSVLSQGGAPPDPVLEGLVTLLCTLREQGGVHEDLQWNNIMVRSTPHGPRLYLIDALHLRWAHESEEAPFRKTLVWFLYFLLQDNAPQGIVDGFIERVHRLGIDGPAARQALLDEARRLARM